MLETVSPVTPKADEGSYVFEAAFLFSSIDSNLAAPLSLNHPGKPHNEARQSRQDFRASHRSSLHRSSSLVFRTLPPIRRMPSLQVPSLTDLSNPHNIPNPRSLNQIRETEATSFNIKLPLTLVHPNSPYVPWEPPVREKILCPLVSSPDSSTEGDELGSEDQPRAELQRDKKPLSSMWSALKLAPKKVKTKCQRLLNPRAREEADLAAAITHASNDPEDEIVTYLPHTDSIPLSPTASFRSTETHSLAVWLSERQRKFLEKDCESSKLITIDEYDRVGSWIKPGENPFTASRTSYQCSFVSDHGDTISSILESEGDLASSPASQTDHASSHFLRTTSSTGRSPFGPKRQVDEERLSRVVHRATLRSYLASERPPSGANALSNPSSP